MTRLPRLTAKECERVLLRLGFLLRRSKGSHRIYTHQDGRRVVLPFHAGQVVKPKTLQGILDDMEIDVEQFIELLRG